MNNMPRNTQEQAELLLGSFFGDYLSAQEGYIALCSSSNEQGWAQEFYADTYYASCRAADLYLQNRDVYFGVNPVSRPNRKARDVKHILRLHVDADFNDSTGLTKLLSLEPTVVIASGTKHRYHAYFNLQAPTCVKQHGERIRQMNRHLTQILGLKEEAFDLARTLRIPGTTNFKDSRNPRPVEIVEWKLERRYTLEQCAGLMDVRLDEPPDLPAPVVAGHDEAIAGERGKYLSKEDRQYINRLLQEGLFEPESRNRATMLLVRHFYEQGYSEDSIRDRIIEFFQHRNNGFSKEWNEHPGVVQAKVRSAVSNWFKKAYPAQKGDNSKVQKRLNRRDEMFIQQQQLNDRDKSFLRHALTWILNSKHGDDLVMSVRQLAKFTNCNLQNYQLKRDLLYKLGIIALASEHDRKDGLANEYKVLYPFNKPNRATRKGRPRIGERNIIEEVDKLLMAGASNQEIRKRMPTFTRQRIQYRRNRLDRHAALSRESLDA